jgi:hypothetical protein
MRGLRLVSSLWFGRRQTGEQRKRRGRRGHHRQSDDRLDDNQPCRTRRGRLDRHGHGQSDNHERRRRLDERSGDDGHGRQRYGRRRRRRSRRKRSSSSHVGSHRYEPRPRLEVQQGRRPGRRDARVRRYGVDVGRFAAHLEQPRRLERPDDDPRVLPRHQLVSKALYDPGHDDEQEALPAVRRFCVHHRRLGQRHEGRFALGRLRCIPLRRHRGCEGRHGQRHCREGRQQPGSHLDVQRRARGQHGQHRPPQR